MKWSSMVLTALLALPQPSSGGYTASRIEPQRQFKSGLTAPLPDLEARVIRDFDLWAGPYAAGHRGIDIRASQGDPIRSPVSGTVNFAGFVVNRPVISVRSHQDELFSFEPVCSELKTGEVVMAGELIGISCIGNETYGHCETHCIHLSLRVAGVYQNPLIALDLFSPSRLFPIPVQITFRNKDWRG